MRHILLEQTERNREVIVLATVSFKLRRLRIFILCIFILRIFIVSREEEGIAFATVPRDFLRE